MQPEYTENNRCLNFICKNCQNYIIEDNGNSSCDYEYWSNVPTWTASMFTPMQFSCVNFEFHEQIKEILLSNPVKTEKLCYGYSV